jgi:hypothetical protein
VRWLDRKGTHIAPQAVASMTEIDVVMMTDIRVVETATGLAIDVMAG